MRYEERYPNAIRAVALLCVTFLILYSPWHLGLKELYSKEGKYAAMALEMDLTRPSTVVHGETLSYYYPMYPFLVAMAYKVGCGIETGLRIVSVLALAALGIIAFETGRKSANLQAGVVASAVMISTLVSMEKAVDGAPYLLGVVFLFIAWLCWFTYGAEKGDWNTAWTVSAAFAGLAFYTIGWMAFFYYFFPLFFMRRPLTLWPKLRLPGFYAALGILAFFVALWGAPRWMAGTDIPFRTLAFPEEFEPGYFSELMAFPFAVALGFLPWSLVAWPPFCVAYYPLDNNPIFNRFLRTIFFSLFFFLWLNPFTSARHMLILLPPLAVMAGSTYWLVVRRHGQILRKLLYAGMIIAGVLAVLSLAAYLTPFSFWEKYAVLEWAAKRFFPYGHSFLASLKWIGLCQTGAAVLIAVLFLKYGREQGAVWSDALAICVVLTLCYWSLTVPRLGERQESVIAAGQLRSDLGKNFSPDLTIYKSKEIADLYIVGCYLGCKVKKIHEFEELPAASRDIYLLSLTPPVFPGRHWEKISEVVYREATLRLWKGSLVENGRPK